MPLLITTTFMLGAFLHVQRITPRIDFQIKEASQFLISELKNSKFTRSSCDVQCTQSFFFFFFDR